MVRGKMPGVVRKTIDQHVGHPSTTPSPFHQTSYAVGSPDVFVEGYAIVRVGDTTACGDPAIGSSPNVYANGILVHRLADATAGHGSWVPNSAQTSSTTVIANGGGGSAPSPEGPLASVTKNPNTNPPCDNFNWVTLICED